MRGGGGDDRAAGGVGRHTPEGGKGDARLAGQAGRDAIDGGPGNEMAIGGRRGQLRLRGPGRAGKLKDFRQGKDEIVIESGAGRVEGRPIEGREGDVIVAFAKTAIRIDDAEVSEFGPGDFAFV